MADKPKKKNADRIDMIIYDELDSGRLDDKDEGASK